MMSLSTSTCQMCLVAYSCLTLCDPMDCSPPGSSVQVDSPSKNTGVGCHFFLQEIFPIQGSNPCTLYWQVDSQILYRWATREAPWCSYSWRKKKEKRQDQKGLRSLIWKVHQDIGRRCWKSCWEKVLVVSFGGQFACISMSYVKSKTPSHFNNTLNCLHIHRRS